MFGMVLVDGMISVANAGTLRLSAVSLLRAWVFGIVVCAMRHIVLPQAIGIHTHRTDTGAGHRPGEGLRLVVADSMHH
ncbi:MAG: hypothetical protein R6V46_12340 [Desulfatiglandaceae bacterium]